MKAVRPVVSSFLTLFILLASWGPAQAQSADVKFFAETGHNVKGEFLKFYNNAKDPALVYGYPITEQMTSKDGKTVQYFQRARFELGKDPQGNSQVQLTAVGQALYKPTPQAVSNTTAGCQTFSTGFRVCFAFLDFFQANGGTAQFGNPISPFEFQDNVIVQYFERARFEWRGDRPESQRVALTDLGRIYFAQLGEDNAQLKAVLPQDNTINPVLSIKVRAFVEKPITRTSGQQTVHVAVQSQTLQPVKDATGKIVIHWADGRTEEYFFVTTAAGVGSATFNFTDQKKGELVPIDVIVVYQGLTGTTTTSFRIWF